jgi:hypothetical protein
MQTWQDFDPRAFTERILVLYSARLKDHIPAAKFILDGSVVSDAIAFGRLQLIGEYAPMSLPLIVDQYIRSNGTIDVEFAERTGFLRAQ